jgi:taurine dioxygenase
VINFDGMTPEESRPILQYLYQVATRADFVYRHRWSAGDVVMWDNRCVMHYGVHDYDDTEPRVMHRTTAAGDKPV